MAISTNDLIDKFGTADTVTAGGGTSAVSNDAFSASGDVVSGGWTNDDDAPLAQAVLKFQYPSGTLSSDGVNLVCRLLNISSTNDEPQPDTGYPGHFLTNIAIDTNQATATDAYYASDPFRLPNLQTSQIYEFYIENKTDVTMSAGWTLDIAPITGGPHA